MIFRKDLFPPKTIVIKVGSRIITSSDAPEMKNRLVSLVHDIIGLRRNKTRVLLVSSGAIAHGMETLNLNRRPSTIPMQQACAAIGQIQLMNRYRTIFKKHHVTVGQVLLTWDDLRNKQRYLNLRNTLFQLLDCGTVPIINENDSVGTEEIRFGDNDTLGSQIAMLVNADLYVILTDVDGLYDANPVTSRTARHIDVVSGVTGSIHAFAGKNRDDLSVGGMVTKLKAAETLTRAGIPVLVGNGLSRRLSDVLKKTEAATMFLPSPRRMSSRRRWIAFVHTAAGALTIDKGAEKAILAGGRSLLPAGIVKAVGGFKAGDMVDIKSENGMLLAHGLTNYSCEEVKKIRGRKSSEIAGTLGFKSFDEVVHRDNLVIARGKDDTTGQKHD